MVGNLVITHTFKKHAAFRVEMSSTEVWMHHNKERNACFIFTEKLLLLIQSLSQE